MALAGARSPRNEGTAPGRVARCWLQHLPTASVAVGLSLVCVFAPRPALPCQLSTLLPAWWRPAATLRSPSPSLDALPVPIESLRSGAIRDVCWITYAGEFAGGGRPLPQTRGVAGDADRRIVVCQLASSAA